MPPSSRNAPSGPETVDAEPLAAVIRAWATGVSGADGAYRFENVPADARLVVEADAYGRVEQEVGQATSLNLPLKATLVTGTVVDA
ncbi:MAG TPA: hypothetical protein VFX03_15940, partial [Thermomicrobiales bacterium]|nr:hypothetical protein [Thermomicrobiales bacterium]